MSKSKFEKWAESQIDKKLRPYSEKVLNHKGDEFTEDLVDILIDSAIKHPDNPQAGFALTERIRLDIVALKDRINKAANHAEHKPKNKIRLTMKSHVTRAELLAICEGITYTARFDALMKMLDPATLKSPMLKSMLGENYSRDLPKFQTVYKRDRKSIKAVKRLERFVKYSKSNRVLRRVISDLNKKFSTWSSDIQGITSTVVDDFLKQSRGFGGALESSIQKTRQMLRDNKSSSEIAKVLRGEMAWTNNKELSNIAVRAVITSTYNQEVIERMDYAIKRNIVKKSAFKGGVISYRFTALIDGKTSHICRSKHGSIIRADDKARLLEFTPPLHVRCRSMLVPNLRK